MVCALAVMLVISGCGKGTEIDAEKENIAETYEKSQEADAGKSEAAASDTEPEESIETDENAGQHNADLHGLKNGDGDESVKIVMVGDVLLHDKVEEAARDAEGNYNFDFIFEEMKDEIETADLAIVNQEVIIGGKELGVSGYPDFNAPYEIGDALVNAGFDVVCHGTNHALDRGKKGILNACAYWKENHPNILVLGINSDKDEYEHVNIIEQNGMKIAILNYSYGTNGIMLSDMPYAIDKLDEDKVRADLSYAEENADFTIVCPHWGTEYRLSQDSYQEEWNEIFRQGGADLILGTHPHVIQPVVMSKDEDERITNNHGGGDMLTYYSLGNYVNWTSGTGEGTANRMVGAMAQVTIGRDDRGEVAITDFGVRALVCHLASGHEGIRVFPLSDYTDELGGQNEIRKQDNSFSAVYCRELCDKVWGAGFWD